MEQCVLAGLWALVFWGVWELARAAAMVGQKSTVAEMVRNNARTLRYTNLKYLIENRMGI